MRLLRRWRDLCTECEKIMATIKVARFAWDFLDVSFMHKFFESFLRLHCEFQATIQADKKTILIYEWIFVAVLETCLHWEIISSRYFGIRYDECVGWCCRARSRHLSSHWTKNLLCLERQRGRVDYTQVVGGTNFISRIEHDKIAFPIIESILHKFFFKSN